MFLPLSGTNLAHAWYEWSVSVFDSQALGTWLRIMQLLARGQPEPSHWTLPLWQPLQVRWVH